MCGWQSETKPSFHPPGCVASHSHSQGLQMLASPSSGWHQSTLTLSPVVLNKVTLMQNVFKVLYCITSNNDKALLFLRPKGDTSGTFILGPAGDCSWLLLSLECTTVAFFLSLGLRRGTPGHPDLPRRGERRSTAAQCYSFLPGPG